MERRPNRVLVAVALASLALGLAAPAAAQDDPAKLQEEAKKLLAEGKTSEACDKLEQSTKLAQKSDTMLELAQCHEKENKTATAVAEYKEAATLAHKEKRYDREKTAKMRILMLEPKLPKLIVAVAAETAGADVTL